MIIENYVGETNYWLRDDKAAGLCDYERYTMFRGAPYGSVVVFIMPRIDAIVNFYFEVEERDDESFKV